MRYATMAFGLAVPVLLAWIAVGLFRESSITRRMFGWSILQSSTWDIERQVYGAWPFIYGTCVSSALALIVAVPVGVGTALFLTEIAPRWLAAPVSFLVELLAAIPSVIYGLWGFLVMCPWLQTHVNPELAARFGDIPLFAGPPYMTNMLAAGLILAIMVLPVITAFSREVLRTVPAEQREASLGLGATRWETIRSVVLPGARSGIFGAVILGLGRAIGETMAVVMVIGSSTQISASLLKPGYTMPALLANQFNEAYADDVQRSALLEIALILFVITLAVNASARLLLMVTSRRSCGGDDSSGGSWRGRAAQAGVWAKRAVAVAVMGVVAFQIVTDVRSRGEAGLAGPLEVAAIVWALTRAGTALTQGTRSWDRWRAVNNAVMHSVMALCAAVACAVLGLLMTYVAVQGARALSWSFFTQLPGPPDQMTGGMANGIVGTLVLLGIAAATAVPAGLLGGIFVAEFGRGRLGGVVRFSADVLNGVPSVVIGMFAYTAFVLPVKHFSALAGGLALGIMMVPTIVRTTEEMLKQVPGSLREASLGLGATRARTIASVVLPAARGGIVTGVMLAIARIAGETAPLLFTAFGNDQLSTRLSQPISSITMMVYRYATSAYPAWTAEAWAGALVLLLLVLVMSAAARMATRSRYALR